MRTTGYLGAAFVLVGFLLVIASTGAFTETQAERGLAVDTADDSSAFLGLDYAGMKSVELEPSDGPYCEGGFFTSASCYHENIELVQFENNTDGDLNISEINIVENGNLETTDDAYNGIRYETGPPGIGRVVGDFECPASLRFSPNIRHQQQSATSTVDIDLVATGDNFTVDLTRTINVECETGVVPL